MVCGFAPLFCFIVGFTVLPRNETVDPHQPFDTWRMALLITMMVLVLIPSIHIQQAGISSAYVYPFFLLTLILIVIFVYHEVHASSPLVPYKSLHNGKQVSGVTMAIASHVALIVTLIGAYGFLRNVKATPISALIVFYLWFILGVIVAALIGMWLYDKLGAGVLGILGSLVVIFVSASWRGMGSDTPLSVLDIQMACVGGSVGLVLIAGALATALAGDLHQARWRSISLHFTRNFIGAIVAPIVAWFLYRSIAIHYETMREHVSIDNVAVNIQVSGLVQRFMDTGLSLADAKKAAFTSIMVNAEKTSVISAYHALFTILLVIGVIMLIASIGMTVTGKGRSLVQKANPVATVLVPQVVPEARQ